MKKLIYFVHNISSKIFVVIISLLYCGHVSTQNPNNQVTGTLGGGFNINGNGASNYSINIEVPSGTNGSAPQLSISYSSQAGNGFLGKGFNLNGISSITRTAATYQEDGFKGGVNYDQNDRFSIGSSRLMKIGGNANGYYSSGTTYHTEIEAWAKITGLGTSGSGPSSFTVISKKGVQYQFGNTPDSQVKAVGNNFKSGNKVNSIRKWYINQEEDLNGNTIAYNYTQSPIDVHGNIISNVSNKGQVYPSQIVYTSNKNCNLSAQRIVRFFYEQRQDTAAQFIGGGIIQTMARLTNIRTYILSNSKDTQLIKDYKISYDANAPLNISRIVSILELSANQALFAMDSYAWTNSPNTFVKNNFTFPGSSTSSGWQGDFNGDGKTDIFQPIENSLSSIYVSAQNGFSTINLNPKITLSSLQLVADFNGDGRTDLVNGSSSSCKLYLSTGNAFQNYISIEDSLFFPSTVNDNTIWTADFNGDGKSDIMSKSGSDIYISFSNGHGFNKYKKFHFPPLNGKNGLTSDFNGDGLADIYVSDSIYLSNWSKGSSFSPGIFAHTSLDENSGFFADFNGDGLGDLIGKNGSKYLLYYSNGSGLENPISFSAGDIIRSNSWLGDYNGDGLIDLLTNSQGNYGIYYSNGIGFNYKPILNLSLSTYKWFGDFNGDNITDIFDANSKKLIVNSDSTNLNKNYNQLPNLLNSIDNNIGGTIRIKYQPITNDTIYSKVSSSDSSALSGGIFNIYNSKPLSPQQGTNYPLRLTQSAMYVASGYSQLDGRGNVYNFGYKYDGAKVDIKGIGWLGFHSISETNSSAQNITTTNYLQNFPFTGKVDSTITQDLQKNTLSVLKNNYSLDKIQNIINANVYQVLQTQAKTEHFDYGQYNYTSSISYKYDSFGNPLLIKNIGDLTKLQNTLFTINSYTNDTLNWHLGFLNKNVKASDSLGVNKLTQSSFTFYPNTFNIKSSSEWLNTSNNWLTTLYGYDAVGNQTMAVDPANDTTIIKFDSIYYTFPNIKISPKNQWNKKLNYVTMYNPAFGVVIGSVDPNGNKFGVLLDQFGRDSVLTGPDSTGNVSSLEILSYKKSNICGIITSKYIRNKWSGVSWDSTESYSDGLSRNYKNSWRGINHQLILQQIEYNSNNKVIKKSNPYFANDSILWTSLSYDPYSRIVSVISPDSIGNYSITKLTYAGKQLTVFEGVGTADSVSSVYTHEMYNSQNKIVQVKNKLGQNSLFRYDLLGRDTSVTDPGGLTSVQHFNSIGNVIKSNNPSAGDYYSIYDYAHRTVSTMDAKGDTVITIFDGLKRPITQILPNKNTYQYQYDLNNTKNGLGKICKVIMSDTGFYYTYQYTPYSQQSNVIMRYKGKSYTEKYVFNPDKSINQLIYPDSSIANYNYYENGLSSQINLFDSKSKTKKFTTFIEYQNYDAESNQLLFQYGNKVSTNKSFLPSGKLMQSIITDAKNVVLANQSYDWNSVNEITSITDHLNSKYSQYFQYDKVGRLSSATGNYGNSNFQYNQSGNMITKDSITFEYANYQVISGSKTGSKVYKAEYDPNGNVIDRTLINGKDSTNVQYVFDGFNRLILILKQNDTLFKFIYDNSGNRVEKTDYKNKVSTIYINSHYEITTTPDSILFTKYVASRNNLIASVTNAKANPKKHSNQTILSGVPTSGVTYYHQDLVNSTRITTNSTGTLGSQIYYKPFGEEYQIVGPHNIRYTFGSKELDESGLYYFSARYYDPVTTRFISADSRLASGKYQVDVFNRYAYTINNPIRYSDPSGNTVLNDIAIAAFFTAEAVADVLTDGALTPEEVEIDADFFAALRTSRKAFTDTEGSEGISQDQAMKSYKSKRDAESGKSLDDRTSDKTKDQFGRPKAYKPMPSCMETGIDNHGNIIYYNKSPDQLESEQRTFNKNVHDGLLHYSSTKIDREAVIELIADYSDANHPYKFTLSFDDFELNVGTHDQCTHAALESDRGGRHVYTAGHVWMGNDGYLNVTNETGHYHTNVSSLKMSDPIWRTLGFNKIKYFQY